jgi:hypothetical protein
MFSVESAGVIDEMDQYEVESGTKIDQEKRLGVALALGGAKCSYSRSLGLESIMGGGL